MSKLKIYFLICIHNLKESLLQFISRKYENLYVYFKIKNILSLLVFWQKYFFKTHVVF